MGLTIRYRISGGLLNRGYLSLPNGYKHLLESKAGIGPTHAEKAIFDWINVFLEMKLKIQIAGPKVHGVGYRNYLMYYAYQCGLSGFDAKNETAD